MSKQRITNTTQAKKIKYDGFDRDYTGGDRLYLRVRKSTSTWIYKDQSRGKRRIKTLGKLDEMNFQDAKEKALSLLRDTTPEHATISHAVSTYYQDLASKNRSHTQAKRYLNQIEEEMGHRRIKDIKRSELVQFLRNYSKRGARTGDVMRGQLNKVFAYAVELGLLENNVMTGVTNNVTGYKAKNRERVLNDDEVRFIMNLDHHNAKILRFILLTGLRITETRTGYIQGDFWTINETKNGKHHWVYLTDLAEAQLPLPKSTNTNIQAWLKRTLIKAGYKDEDRFTTHDLRRTHATRLNEHGIAPHIVEKCLNHSLEGVLAVYNHAEYKEQRIEAAIAMESICKKFASYN